MIHLPNNEIRRRIGLDDNRYGQFTEQLKAKGWRDLGFFNGIAKDSANDLTVRCHEFLEIYSTGAGYSIWVSEGANAFYEKDSS